MSDSITTVQRVREVFKNEPTKFVTAYVVSGILAILIPGIKHAATMSKYKHSYYYSYVISENAQEEEREGDYFDVNNCKWWQWSCKPDWANSNGEAYQDQNQGDANAYYSSNSVPGWISGWGEAGNSEDGASTHSSGGLKFVYAWQVVMFFGLLAYGSLVLFKYRGNLAQSRIALQSLWLLIFFFGNFSFLSMWMLANGSIYTMGRELEEVGGFYHQFSVLMFTTNFWYCIWSLGFVIAVGRRIRNIGNAEAVAFVEKEGMDYLQYSEHGVASGDAESCIKGGSKADTKASTKASTKADTKASTKASIKAGAKVPLTAKSLA